MGIKRTLLKSTFILTLLSSSSSALAASTWLYFNSSSQLTAVVQPDLTQKIVDPKTTEMKGVEYDASVEITSIEQVKKFREDKTQPLYLRNYLSVPALGINLQVYEGTGNRALSYGAGTIKADQDLNKMGGNYALAAHNFQDAQWGHGFSSLQAAPSVAGMNAYISDGEYIYTYRLFDKKVVFREDSMVWTEDDYTNQHFQSYIKTLPSEYRETVIPDRVYDTDGTSVENTDRTEFEYAKLMTFYTCLLEGVNHNLSWDRILVTGVQVDKQKIVSAPEDVRKLFLDESGNQTITNVEEVPEETKQNLPLKSEDSSDVATATPKLSASFEEEGLFPLWDEEVKKDPDLPLKITYGGTGIFLASIGGLVALDRKKEKTKAR